jgi:hypothetical protein
MIKVVKHSSTHTVKTLVGMTEESLAIHVLADPSSTSFWTLIHFLNGWKILKKMMIVTGKFGTAFRMSLTGDYGLSLVQSSMLILKHLFCSFSSSRGNSVSEAIETRSSFIHFGINFHAICIWELKYLTVCFSRIFYSLML